MPEPAEIFAAGSGAVVAPAGHGKTELIAKVAALCRRALILTHTTAGVDALRARLKRLGVPHSGAAVDTIAGWCARYAYAFPSVAKPPADTPKNSEEWERLYGGAAAALSIPAVREVVSASYDKILIDEYQDCNAIQHELVVALSKIESTIVFGDALQGIFEFDRPSLDWDGEVHPSFPLLGQLRVPHRWAGKNLELAQWISETREKLLAGAEIDLDDPRITFRESRDAFDMDVLFNAMEGKEGSVAAIHCNKRLCYGIAKATSGRYQAIEENAANTLRNFARAWDRARDGEARFAAIMSLLGECFHLRPAEEGVEIGEDEWAFDAGLAVVGDSVKAGERAEGLTEFINLARKHPRWRLFRAELWRDAERTAREMESGRFKTMLEAADGVRHRASAMGRRLPVRTVSTPLLLKGLEFDHVVIPEASHFENEQKSQARLFYVAISRATRSLVIGSSKRRLRFPMPSA